MCCTEQVAMASKLYELFYQDFRIYLYYSADRDRSLYSSTRFDASLFEHSFAAASV